MNRLLSKLREPWAITPQALDDLASIVEAKIEGLGAEDVFVGATHASSLRKPAPAESGSAPGYVMDGQVAVIPVEGTLYRRRYLMACNQTYGDIQTTIERAVNDPAVAAVVLDFDSPGGGVHGVAELAQAIDEANTRKPVHAYASGNMASAAYWLASACRQIWASPQSSVGSINTITVHTDRSARDEKDGIRRTFLSPGRLKAAGNDAEPLSDEARQYIMDHLVGLTSQFVDQVAKGRNMDRAAVESLADGQVWLAKDAAKLGLIDRAGSRREFLRHINKELIMNLEDLKAKHPELVSEARAEWEAEAASAMTEGVSAARAEERGRILDLASAIYGEDAARLQKAVEANVTADQVKAMAGIFSGSSAGAGTQAAILEELKAAHGQGLASAGSSTPKPMGMSEYAREKYGE
ncbi:MAG: S49 family peptidase [Deltaproteobacteria bacterium]|nr:S49 family peptidase [Deltaproteobacteria bacterium]